MKTVVASLVLVMSFSTCVWAQFTIIPKAGINFSGISSPVDDDDAMNGSHEVWYADPQFTPGFVSGLAFNYRFLRYNIFSLQPELLFTQKGFATRQTGENRVVGTYRLNYIEAPVLLRADYDIARFKVYAYAGPSLAYLLTGRVTGEEDIFGIAARTLDNRLEFKEQPARIEELKADRVEIGINVGGGIGYNLRGTTFLLDFRYGEGLTNYDRDRQSRNRVVSITLGAQILLGY